MNITVVGLGFVGLTTALGFSEKGVTVFGYDSDTNKTAKIEKGILPFFEPNMDQILQRHLGKRFQIADHLEEAVKNSQIVFYCVGTPNKRNGSADLRYLFRAIESTLQWINKGDFTVIVIKSTVPPSTTTEQVKPFIEKKGFAIGHDIGLANNPEFLREGYAWNDFVNPDRIVIGVSDSRSAEILHNLYVMFGAPINIVSLNTGEFIKYLSNNMLATLISFSNEMSMIGDMIGDIDIRRAFEILHQDKRWFGEPANMTSYVYPGCGFGGYCLPKDTEAMIMQSQTKGYVPQILKSVLGTNSIIKDHLIGKIEQTCSFNQTIGILGLSFKPLSDDVRETPAKDFIERLIMAGYTKIIAYDPLAINQFKAMYALPIDYASNLDEIVEKADLFVLLTAWKEFKDFKKLVGQKKVFDFRYFL